MENINIKSKEVLVKRNSEGELVVTSRQVSEDFEKEHSKVIRTIENLFQGIAKSGDTPSKYFIMDSYENEQNKQKYIQYLITQRGFSLLVMGFTGEKALQWKIKYIEAFNKMEQAIKNPYAHLSKELQAIFTLDIEQQRIKSDVKELKEGMPLFNVECKELQALVRKKGIEILGGKVSPAYKDNSIRGKVYSDIQHQIKREFGVTRYEAIKRIQLDKAKEIVNGYKAPYVLEYEIKKVNSQINFGEVI